MNQEVNKVGWVEISPDLMIYSFSFPLLLPDIIVKLKIAFSRKLQMFESGNPKVSL